MNKIIFAILALFIIAVRSDAQPSMQSQYETARQHYDMELAKTTRTTLLIQESEPSLLYAKVCLLIAELYRIDYEDTPNHEGALRRALGAQIDQVADEGLSTIGDLEETSERYRVEADLIGCKIRTKFKSRKYRHKMNDAIARAREMDPKNTKALLSASKPFLFGRDNKENIALAIDLISQALELNPKSEHAWLMRGLAHKEMGQPEQAQRDWEKALECNPHSTLAISSIQALQAK